MTPSWLLDLLTAIMLVISVANAVRIARPLLAATPWRPLRAGTDVDLANVLMGIAMAGMFTPGVTMLPDGAWEVLFGLLTAWFAYRAWADARSVRGMAADRCTIHVVHAAAMLYMFLAIGPPASGGAGMGGMSGSAAMSTLSHPTLAGVFVLLLVGYSVWDLNQLSGGRYSLASAGPATGVVSTAAAASGTGTSGRSPAVRAFVLAPETRVGSDVILGIGMALMLVFMI